ncbi:iron transporter [Methanococcoides sp. SA1]|nr:iron transporter [Methanococcoides sp. SA1]
MVEKLLNELEAGTKAKIAQVKGKGSSRRRLLELGLLPGVEINVIKRAPLGDPIELKVKGYNLSLRKNESEMIVVLPLED